MAAEGIEAVVFAGPIVAADFVRSLLAGAGIRAYLLNAHMGTLAPWQVGPGGAGAVQVVVAAGDAAAAREIVAAFRHGDDLPA
ncbi:hypothetical protein DCC79_11410 [bacterium]|nr:MAG: hypothetical protein DCC79_11410 [bacterium]